MKHDVYRIFISGTYTDLKSERDVAVKILTQLEYIPVTMPFSAVSRSGTKIKREESLRKLKECDGMILILGRRYGEPDQPPDPRSITEVEFDWAIEQNMKFFVFVAEPWATLETNPIIIEQQRKFKAKVEANKLYKSYRNADDLKSQIQLALHNDPVDGLVTGKPFHRWNQFYRDELADSAPAHINLKHPLLCRMKELKTLKDFSAAEEPKICAITAGQGIGKSRLLLEFAQKEDEKERVLFLNVLAFNSGQFDKTTIESIPNTKGTIVIFDDAHEVGNLLIAILQVLDARPQAKVLIAGRPSLEFQSVVKSLSENHRTLHLVKLELSPLKDDPELTDYVASLFPNHRNPGELAKQLHRGSGGVAWILHFGILFLKEGRHLPPGLISRNTEFREFVVNKILEGRQNAKSGQILQWLALISPVERNQQDWVEKLKKILATSDIEINAAVDLWRDENLLRIKGRNVIFRSEIVRDFFVLQLADNPKLRDLIFEHFWDPLLKNILRNLAIGAALDRFDASGQPSEISPIFEEVWNRFKTTLYSESYIEQKEILKWLEPVAWYQPSQVRDLLAYIKDNPSDKPNPDVAQHLKYKWSHHDVLVEFPPLLKAIAHHREYFVWATDLLWELASTDERQTNPYPEHPLRTLGDIAKYQPGKPLWLTESLVERVRQWIRGTAGKIFAHSPIETILGKALARETQISWFKGPTLFWSTMLISPDLVLGIQKKVLDLLFELLQDQGKSFAPHFVVDAIHVLREFSSGPHQLILANSNDVVEAKWMVQATDTLKRIREVACDSKIIPIVRFHLWQELDWLSEYGKGPLQKLAYEIRDLLEKQKAGELEFRLYRYSRSYIHKNEENDVWSKFQEQVANDLLNAYPKNHSLIDFLKEVTNTVAIFGIGSADPYPILMAAGNIDPMRTISLSYEIISGNHKALFHFIPDLVGPSLSKPEAQTRAREFIRQNLLRQPNVEQVAEIYRMFCPTPPSEEDLLILEYLISLPSDQSTDRLCYSLLRTLWRVFMMEGVDRNRVKTLLLRIGLHDDPKLTDELFMILTGKEVFPTLTPADMDIAIGKLKQLPKLDQAYHVEQFLSAVAKQDPKSIMMLFRDRFALAQKKTIERALPYIGYESVYSAVRMHLDYETMLREVRDMTLEFTGILQWEVRRLFSELAGLYDENVRAILLEWINGGDLLKINLAISLLHEAPNSIVLEQVDFIDNLFRRLITLSGDQSEIRKHLRSSLMGSVIQGPETRPLGSPSVKYFRLREMASEIARNSLGKYCQDTIDFYRLLAQDAASTLEMERLLDEEILEE